jgi:PAS domain S-box-containing protein
MGTIKRFAVLRIVAIYAVFGSLWIYLSDSAIALLFRDPDIITRIALFKGLLFITLTASLLYVLIKRYTADLAASHQRLTASEDRLRRSEEDLKSVLELMPVGVRWSTNDGVIEYVNRNFIERFGYTPDELPTVDRWLSLVYPDPAYRRALVDDWNADIAEARRNNGQVPPREAEITCKDGTILHTLITASLTPNRIIAIFTDITDHEHRRAELIKIQKLESLGVLAGGIAHDFNNILTAILGNISCARLFIGHDHQAAVTALREAERASKRAAELSNQLLTFAKGGQPLAKAVSVRKLIEESVSLMLRGSSARGVLRLADNLPAVTADAGQISQVFNNLIINAVQAMPDGGTITVRADRVTIPPRSRTGLEPGEYVKISFTDTGCGIPPEDQKRVFDPYFTTKPQGSGLGLASAHSVILKHQGRIELYSEVGTGTTFDIFLPSSGDLPQLLDESPREPTPAEDSGLAVLVMDDETAICELAARMLAALGYRATTCNDGHEAVALYREALAVGAPYWAVIMDLTIPGGMGGTEAARRIRELDPDARLIVSSGYSHDPVLAGFRSYGFCDAIAKPYKVTELEAILRRQTTSTPKRC